MKKEDKNRVSFAVWHLKASRKNVLVGEAVGRYSTCKSCTELKCCFNVHFETSFSFMLTEIADAHKMETI